MTRERENYIPKFANAAELKFLEKPRIVHMMKSFLIQRQNVIVVKNAINNVFWTFKMKKSRPNFLAKTSKGKRKMKTFSFYLSLILFTSIHFISCEAKTKVKSAGSQLQVQTKQKMKKSSRQIFYQSKSYVEGKRIEALDLLKQWRKLDEKDKTSICKYTRESFENFDFDLLSPLQRSFVEGCFSTKRSSNVN